MFEDYERKICLLIDMSVPTDNNISVKEYNKISKYKHMEIETEKMWHLKITTMEIYQAFCLDVAQGHMKGAPNETRTHSCWFASQAC